MNGTCFRHLCNSFGRKWVVRRLRVDGRLRKGAQQLANSPKAVGFYGAQDIVSLTVVDFGRQRVRPDKALGNVGSEWEILAAFQVALLFKEY